MVLGVTGVCAKSASQTLSPTTTTGRETQAKAIVLRPPSGVDCDVVLGHVPTPSRLVRSIRVVRAITKSSGVDGVTQGGRLGVAVASAGSRSALGTSGALAQVSASARVAKWRPEALSHGSLRKGGAAWRLYALRSHALPRLIRPRPRAARTSTCLPLRMFVPSDLRLATEAHVHKLARGRPGSFHAWRSIFT